MKIMTRESLNKEVATNPVVTKFSKKIAVMESARKASGAKAMTPFQKYYAAQLFENIQKGNLYEAYTQPSNVGNFKRDAFNITTLAIQNTILPEIVSVQPMSTAAQLLPILELKYGTNKGETKAGDLVLDATGAGKTDANYDSVNVVNSEVATGATNFLAPFTPIVPGSVKVTGAAVVTDDGAGALSDGGTIDYATGVITFAAAAVAGTKVSFKYDNSVVPNYLYPELADHAAHQVGDVTLGIRPVLIEAEEHKIRAIYGLTSAYRINKEYGRRIYAIAS